MGRLDVVCRCITPGACTNLSVEAAMDSDSTVTMTRPDRMTIAPLWDSSRDARQRPGRGDQSILHPEHGVVQFAADEPRHTLPL